MKAVVPLLIVLLPSAAGGQENAVAGSVWAKAAPVSQVRVTVAQKPDINDLSREKDGVYVLPVPRSLKKIDLVYEHESYIRAADEDIRNDQQQNKRPIVTMQPNDPKTIGELSDAELDRITGAAERYKIKGLVENLPMLSQIGEANLKSLFSAALVVRDLARKHSQEGKDGESEAEFKRAVAIQQRVDRTGLELAQTLDDYAGLLRRNNRPEANMLARRASVIRFSLIPREAVSYLATLPSGRYEAEFTGFSKNTFWTASSSPEKFSATVALTHMRGRITGEVETPQGAIAISSGSYQRGKLRMKVENPNQELFGGKQMTINGSVGYGEIVGEWAFAGQTGTVKLKPTFPVWETWAFPQDPISGPWEILAGFHVPSFPLRLTLKLVEGNKVIGTVDTNEGAFPIKNGAFVDNRLTFVVATPDGTVFFFTATPKQDKLSGEFLSGDMHQRKWEAKRAVVK